MGNLDNMMEKEKTREIVQLWETHCVADWPGGLGPLEGQLMTLDTVISGCVTYFFESQDGLDKQRVGILQDCLADRSDLLGDLEEEPVVYFERIKRLGFLLLEGKS